MNGVVGKPLKKREKEQSMLEQAMALNANDPRYQALISGAEGGPFAVGSVGNVAKGAANALPVFYGLRHSVRLLLEVRQNRC